MAHSVEATQYFLCKIQGLYEPKMPLVEDVYTTEQALIEAFGTASRLVDFHIGGVSYILQGQCLPPCA